MLNTAYKSKQRGCHLIGRLKQHLQSLTREPRLWAADCCQNCNLLMFVTVRCTIEWSGRRE